MTIRAIVPAFDTSAFLYFKYKIGLLNMFVLDPGRCSWTFYNIVFGSAVSLVGVDPRKSCLPQSVLDQVLYFFSSGYLRFFFFFFFFIKRVGGGVGLTVRIALSFSCFGIHI